MKNTSLIWAMALLLAGLSSCDNKNSCANREEKNLRLGLQEAIPYADRDLIRFKTNEGDTFKVAVTRKFEILKPDVPVVCEEYLEIHLKDPNKTYPFVESIQRGLSVDSMIQMSISLRRENGKGTIVQFYVDKNQKIAGFKNSLYQANNLSSVVVDGKTYQNVLKLDYNAPDDPSSIAQVLYNQEYCIIQCRSKDGFLVTKI